MSKSNAAIANKVERIQNEMAPNQVIMERDEQSKEAEPRTVGMQDEQFPTAALTAPTKQDKEMGARLAFSDGQGRTPFGQLEARDKDFKWLQEKQKAAEAANFQQWFAAEFDRMDPAGKAHAIELFPEFYAQRKKLLKRQARNLYDLTRIKIEGVQNYDDLVKTYLAETGRIDLGPLQHLMHPEQDFEQERQLANFQRGIFSPFRVFGNEGYNESGSTLATNRYARAYDFRPNADSDYGDLGLTTGFPPMGNDNNLQGDVQWYEALQMPSGL